MPIERRDGPVPPEPEVEERKLNWGIMAYEGDPGADMIRAIRNIEFYAARQNELNEGILKALRMLLDAKPAAENTGVEVVPRKPKVE